MQLEKRPYAVLPKLVEQPTWGGSYIAELKKIDHTTSQKLGQSYELSNTSLLLPDLKDVSGRGIGAVLQGGNPNTVPISQLHPAGRLPLIKLTQAAGNSFQLHIVPGTAGTARWKPKAESWFYLEQGTLTFGIKEGMSTDEYHVACKKINNLMILLSQDVFSKKKTPHEARTTAAREIKQINPWQYVNTHRVAKNTAIDLSGGGVHHSWEEDPGWAKQGNIVYEVQEDIDDSACTIRSFDQGKIRDDGTIREIHIDDYFTYLDTKPQSNDMKNHCLRSAGRVFNSVHYQMEVVDDLSGMSAWRADGSFHHLYVQRGVVAVRGGGVELVIEAGHSCFIPLGTSYETQSGANATLLKTYKEQSI